MVQAPQVLARHPDRVRLRARQPVLLSLENDSAGKRVLAIDVDLRMAAVVHAAGPDQTVVLAFAPRNDLCRLHFIHSGALRSFGVPGMAMVPFAYCFPAWRSRSRVSGDMFTAP